jgi:hypothetical protein
MRWIAVFAVLAVALVAASGEPAGDARPSAAAAVAGPLSPGEQLKYIGRDASTGLPAAVDDRFIAETERAVERYGKDDRPAIPPPPPGDLDLARVALPALGVDARIARFGVDRFGRLDVPQDAQTVGWHPGFTSLPGEGASTFLAAHFEYAGRPGVFNRLSASAPGDAVVVTLSNGQSRRYTVTGTVDYPLGAIDMGAILAGLEGAESVLLMTCSGPANEGEYPLRTVVIARAVP